MILYPFNYKNLEKAQKSNEKCPQIKDNNNLDNNP